MKRKELEEFKKRWEENLGGLGEMLNSPWFAVSIKYDEAEKNKCCIKLGQYVLRYWAQLHGVDLSPYGDKEITTDEFKQAVTKAQTEMKTDFEGGEGNAENNILDQLKRRLNIILFGTTKPEEDQKIKLGKNDLLSASNVVFFDELLKTDVGDLKTIIDDREIGNITGAQKKHVHIEYEEHNKRKKQEIELDDYYKEMIVRGLRSLEKNEWIKTSLKRTAQSRLDSLYPPETPDEVEEDSYLTECGGWIVFNELDLELRLCEKHFPRANLVNAQSTKSAGLKTSKRRSIVEMVQKLKKYVPIVVCGDVLYYYNGYYYEAIGLEKLIKLYRKYVDYDLNNEPSLYAYKDLYQCCTTDPELERSEPENQSIHAPLENGVYDLMKKELKPHDPRRLIFTYIKASYDESAECSM